jgi:hypothetical protein
MIQAPGVDFLNILHAKKFNCSKISWRILKTPHESNGWCHATQHNGTQLNDIHNNKNEMHPSA